MANITRIDCNFTQTGPCCVISSYCIIQSYFSKDSSSVDDIMKQYCRYANIPDSLSKKEREFAINRAYHKYCQPNDMRGFDYIRILHERNSINTRNISRIIKSWADKNMPIATPEISELQNSLKEGDRLLLVLYPHSLSENIWHAIIIGWEIEKKSFFIRDPEEARTYENNDIFNQIAIYEYILFEAPNIE